MIETVLLAVAVTAGVVLAMSVGALFGRKPITGSCGGLAAAGLSGDCAVCGGKPEACRKRRAAGRVLASDSPPS